MSAAGRDRAAVVTTAVLQIACTALRDWLHGGTANFAVARTAIEGLLRDEFYDAAQQAVSEMRLIDEPDAAPATASPETCENT
jgi:hypothetical protein